jgi:hypothetical protein
MAAWSNDELKKIEKTEELTIAGLRRDGILRKPVIIWVVRLGQDLYVRSVNGRDSAWFRGVLLRHEGQIRAGGVIKDVAFEEKPDSGLNDRIDEAYRRKYGHYAASIINSINSPKARSATLQLVVRETNPS